MDFAILAAIEATLVRKVAARIARDQKPAAARRRVAGPAPKPAPVAQRRVEDLSKSPDFRHLKAAQFPETAPDYYDPLEQERHLRSEMSDLRRQSRDMREWAAEGDPPRGYDASGRSQRSWDRAFSLVGIELRRSGRIAANSGRRGVIQSTRRGD